MREVFYGVRGLGRTVELASSLFWRNEVYLSLLPFFICCVWCSTPLFLLWHRRLGHVSSPRLRYFISTGMLGSVPNIEISTCMGCKLGKKWALPFLKTKDALSTSPFDLVSACLSVIERRIIRICHF